MDYHRFAAATVHALLFVLLLAVGASTASGQEPERPQPPAPPSQDPPAQYRADVSGLSGAVVAGHPLAAAAGYEVLRRGGNATDAAVTMAAVLAVVRPHMNGVGGDAFALFY